MKKLEIAFVILFFIKLTNSNQTRQIATEKNFHQKETRSLFNQIKSFAKELIENGGKTDVANLLVEHIETCQFICENEGS